MKKGGSDSNLESQSALTTMCPIFIPSIYLISSSFSPSFSFMNRTIIEKYLSIYRQKCIYHDDDADIVVEFSLCHF